MKKYIVDRLVEFNSASQMQCLCSFLLKRGRLRNTDRKIISSKGILFYLLLLLSSTLHAQQFFLGNGRQLFIETVLIEDYNLKRVHHVPAYYSLNPVVKADKKWELNAMGDPYAAPFSGGVWYDEKQEKFKMWYSAGGGKKYGLITCYAESADGKNWVKSSLDVVPGTNIVDTLEHDCVSVILDKFEEDLSKRFKMFLVEFNNRYTVSMKLKYSADGIHWGKVRALSGELYDRCATYYDPFRKEYVLSLKTKTEEGRARNYLSHKDPELLVSLAHRTFDKTSDKFIRYWFSAEDDDPRNPMFPQIRPQIYNHEAMPYENILIGYFTVWQGPENDVCDSLRIQKRNEVLIGYSKDGFHWNRENKTSFLPVSGDAGEWNAGNVQSAAGSPIIVGDSLYFYVSGRYNSKPVHDSNFSTGLSLLRRDGFTSLQAGKEEGYMLTRAFSFDGKYFFVNADVTKGKLLAEIQDAEGNPIKGFTQKECIAMNKKNSTRQLITWKGKKDLSLLEGKCIRVKFYLTNGDLYSFWISSWETGESRGYTAGGGPGLGKRGVDTND